ncbi:hypothetical protein ACIBJF_47290 [Streptomyces sp. NPDC050743]|uniref:hypothetical protein n=1 Tax=Streptomyces sp. NPDC050743 TaxID=3365634 RepID=UPI00379686E0
MRLATKVAAPLGAAALAVTGTVTLASPASAAETCPYPYVCFYDSSALESPGTHIIGKFQVVTSGWQWLSGAKGAAFVLNTRHDDVAYMHMTDGTVYCVLPGGSKNFDDDYPNRIVDAIRISWSSTC